MTVHGVTAGRGATAPQIDETTRRTPEPDEGTGAIDLATDRVETSGTRRAREAETPRPVEPAASPGAQPREIEGAAHAYASGGAAELDAWMDSHPAEMRALLSHPRGDVETAVRGALGRAYTGALSGVRAWHDADVIVDRVVERAIPMLREAVRREAVAGIDRQLDALERTSSRELLDRLRQAAPGSPEARLAEAVGARGNEMDVERVGSYRHHAIEQLRELRGVVMGGTWSPDELPGTTARVAARMGLERAREGSIADEAFERGADAAEVAAHVEMAADGALSAVEIAHFAHIAHSAHAAHAVLGSETAGAIASGAAVGAAVTLGVAVAALAFGVELHHAIEDNRAERRDVARSFGL